MLCSWGPEALKAFSQVATHLAISGNTSISKVLANLYGRLSHLLIRANAHAILTPSYCHLDGLYVKHCTLPSRAQQISNLYILLDSMFWHTQGDAFMPHPQMLGGHHAHSEEGQTKFFTTGLQSHEGKESPHFLLINHSY